MGLAKYITDEKRIKRIKDEYSNGNLSMKDILNGTYSDLPVEDKVSLLCWSEDTERFKVLKNGRVVNKYTVKKLLKYVKKYVKQDGCEHYILEDSDGAIIQTCDAWVDYDIDAYVRENNAKLLVVVNP